MFSSSLMVFNILIDNVEVDLDFDDHDLFLKVQGKRFAPRAEVE